MVPAASQPYTVCDPGPEKVLRFDPGGPRRGVYTLGRLAREGGAWHINDAGWNSLIEYRPPEQRRRPLVAVVGDSFVEAFQVDVERSVGARLGARFGGEADVYAFGKSGAPLSQYLQMARYVRRVYAPQAVVVNIVHNDLLGSSREEAPAPDFLQLEREGAGFREAPPAGGYALPPGRRALRHSAVFRYLLFNAAAFHWGHFAAAARPHGNVDLAHLDRQRALVAALTDDLARRFAAECAGLRLLFVMDGPRQDIHRARLAESPLVWMNAAVREAAARHGIALLDLTRAFQAHFEATGERLNGELDGHWNAAAHEIAAREIASALRAGGPLAAGR